MEPTASPPSPPAGWALTQDLPPGYVKEKARPGTRLWIAYLILFAIGSILNIFGYWVRYQSTSTTAANNPAAQFHSGQVMSAIGFLFIVAGLVVAIVAIAVRVSSPRGTSDGSASRSDSSVKVG
jgi:hypothetical protein